MILMPKTIHVIQYRTQAIQRSYFLELDFMFEQYTHLYRYVDNTFKKAKYNVHPYGANDFLIEIYKKNFH